MQVLQGGGEGESDFPAGCRESRRHKGQRERRERKEMGERDKGRQRA